MHKTFQIGPSNVFTITPGGAVVSGLGASDAICFNLPRVSGDTNKQPSRITKSNTYELRMKKKENIFMHRYFETEQNYLLCHTQVNSLNTLLWPLLLTWFNFNPSMDK